jgi:hypothetical protein
MIYFPATLTPVPHSPGYFWDVKTHKLFSLKVGGELRELQCRKLWGGAARHFPNRHKGALHYQITRNGRRSYLFVENLKQLELVEYDIPVITHKDTNNEDSQKQLAL